MKFGTKLKRHKTKKHLKTLNDVINTVFPDNEIPKYTYLGWESSIKYLRGNQIETFTPAYTHIHTETHT